MCDYVHGLDLQLIHSLHKHNPSCIVFSDDDSSEMDSLFKRVMPWLHDDVFLKDSQSAPGINFAQWMNMQQSPLLNPLQSACAQSVPGPVLASLAEAGPSQHYGLLTSQFPQSNPPYGVQMPRQQPDQLTKVSTLNPCSTSYEQPRDHTQQSRNLVNQLPPRSHYVQPQNILQNQFVPHAQGSIPHLSNQQQLPPTSHNLGQISDKGNQQISSNQIQLQMMQRLQQQEQSLHFQQSIRHHVGKMASFQDQQTLVADVAHNFPIPATGAPAIEMPQAVTASTYPCIIKLPQQQHNGSDTVHSNGYVSSSTQQLRSVQQPELQFPAGFHGSRTNKISGIGLTELTGVPEVGQSLNTNGLPSCSASNLNENFMIAAKSMKGVMPKGCMQNWEAITSSAFPLSAPGVIDSASSSNSFARCSDNNSALMISSFTEKNKIAHLDNTMVLNNIQSHMSYLGVPYSSTPVCQPRNIANTEQNFNPSYFGFQPMMDQGGAGFVDPRNNVSFETNAGPNTMPLNHEPLLSQDIACLRKSKSLSEDMLHEFNYSKDPQPEPSSSIVSQSYGVPDMTFNSIESTLSDSNFLATKPPCAPPPQQYQRMRTYTKVESLTKAVLALLISSIKSKFLTCLFYV